jgi:pimeloyl-ACP methyl ester carboxylesterase
MPEFEPITGRYVNVGIGGERHRIYLEEAGQGLPLLCLHTAGNDSRQFRHLMNDAAITGRFRVVAFDMPYHGRSTPPDRWWLKKFRLTTESYLDISRSVWLALGLERPTVLGCSMGGAIVLKLAARYQDEMRGIIGLESSAYAPGRYNDFLHHPAIHGGELCASYTYGLLVVLQSIRPGRLSRRRLFLQHRLGRARRYQTDRYQALPGCASDRRI